MPDQLDRKLTAIMFADIVSYSRMMGANEEEALKLLSDFDSLSIPIVEKFNGTLIKKNGDEIFCEFLSAKNAVDASVEIQNKLAAYNDSRPKDFKLEVRIGVHIGDVVKKDGDIFGDGVNVAARIQPLAAPGGVCISGAVSEALSSHPGYDIVSKGKQELKHIVQQHSIFDLKTGHERNIIIPSKGKRRFVKPIIVIPIFAILAIATYFGYNYFSDSDKVIDNAYFDITSSSEYIDHYYIDYGYGSTHFYEKDKYKISSIPDSVRNYILESVYSTITSNFRKHNITIDASFDKDEALLLNELPFLKRMDLKDEEFDSTKTKLNSLGNMIKKRNNSFDLKHPDALVRLFIYNVYDIKEDINYYIWDMGTSWGEHLKKGYATVSWAEMEESFGVTAAGTDSLIDIISDRVTDDLETIFFANDKVYEKVGKVIEILEDDMIKIKQDEIGKIKKKMKLSTYRTYFWAKGGAEIAIEDLSYVIDYLQSSSPLTLWEKSKLAHGSNKDLFDEQYNEIQVKDEVDRQLSELKTKVKGIQEALDGNKFPEFASTNTKNFAYTMEVVDVIEDIVIAKVVGSNSPKGSFIYRLDDSVELTE